jgi:epsilon-lactone hydrolase
MPQITNGILINECMAVDRRVAEHHAPYALSGVSAGGGLVLAMYHVIQSEQLPEPEPMLLFTPAADLTGEAASFRSNKGRHPLIACGGSRRAGRHDCADARGCRAARGGAPD